MEKNQKIKEAVEWILCIIIAIVIALTVRYFVGTPTVVQQPSMYPTLKEGQRLWLSRWSRTTKKMPERGEIITFEAPGVTYYKKEGQTEEIYNQAKEADLSNPIAKYTKTFNGALEKFNYYVLERGKLSYIKRVIGLPGEYVEIKDGKVYINGEELQEDYLQPGVVTDLGLLGVFSGFTVPQNCVFVLGDNRTQSTDSRAFGCIPLEKIESKVVIRIWPLNLFGKIK